MHPLLTARHLHAKHSILACKITQSKKLYFLFISLYISQSHPCFSPSSLSQENPKKQRKMRPSQSILQFMIVVFSVLNTSLHAITSDPPLTLDYYASTCPTLFEIIRKEMECSVLSDPRNAALILRLHFHDCFVQVLKSFSHYISCFFLLVLLLVQVGFKWIICFSNDVVLVIVNCVQGCDGSVLLEDTITLQGEKKASSNIHSLKGFRMVDRIKNKLESECPGIVSCADILTIAARDAVILVRKLTKTIVVQVLPCWNVKICVWKIVM